MKRCATVLLCALLSGCGGGGPARLQEEIRITLLHELAHYFGLDEERLDELGYS